MLRSTITSSEQENYGALRWIVIVVGQETIQPLDQLAWRTSDKNGMERSPICQVARSGTKDVAQAFHQIVESANGEARQRDPLELLLDVNTAVYRAIEYVPKSTRVDSPVGDALHNRKGVYQDYAHMPGSRPTCRASAGPASTLQIISSRAIRTCALPSGAIMPTYRPRAGCLRVMQRAS